MSRASLPRAAMDDASKEPAHDTVIIHLIVPWMSVTLK